MAAKRRKIEANGAATTNGNAQLNGHATPKKQSDLQKSASKDDSSRTTVDILRIFLPTFTFIFGGCCSNVYALEALIKTSPSAGTLITALQFLVTSLITLPANVDVRSPGQGFLRARKIPLKKWIIYTAYFLAINILNNCAFGYSISIPLHIILRSAGPVTTMLVFYFYRGRRYPPMKVFAVLLLFAGVVVAAAADAYSKTPEAFESTLSTQPTEPPSSRLPWNYLPTGGALREQGPGFLLLAGALVLSAFMGLYSDELYGKYGRGAQITSEGLFYSHALSLPFFAAQTSTISSSFMDLSQNSVPLSATFASGTFPKLPTVLASIPTAIPMLMLNAVTQYICIKGVNQLSAKSSSLTVSIVLNIRKLVSLLLSIWLFGNQLPAGVVAGAVLVFLGGGLYAVPTGGPGKVQADACVAGREKKTR
ncbi:UDP-N-acetylglucosamine transporter yea4 [Cyphellophora attinorum]|uniref:UDP-N-acetylglucosamine transporter yea4 n=1 Tax=Cyphellophora attinorum TaxID=1664694 RepID=A0A0N0NI92_9EURO|nr:UDP-N-acetylglucosamine transporter yea4 [Phialophora attinorum]KPI35571.1 UDP-N-acetylglucosamine transporter yea4 [Phialophora attinorum]